MRRSWSYEIGRRPVTPLAFSLQNVKKGSYSSNEGDESTYGDESDESTYGDESDEEAGDFRPPSSKFKTHFV